VIPAFFDGDTNIGLAVSNNGNATMSILHGNGNGTFSLLQNPSTGSNIYGIAAADFNGDGIQDLAAANYNNDAGTTIGTVSIFIGNGNGTFSAATQWAAGSGPRFVVTGDFDGDGKTDVAVTNRGWATVSILRGNGDGTFSNAAGYGTLSAPYGLAAGDLN